MNRMSRAAPASRVRLGPLAGNRNSFAPTLKNEQTASHMTSNQEHDNQSHDEQHDEQQYDESHDE